MLSDLGSIASILPVMIGICFWLFQMVKRLRNDAKTAEATLIERCALLKASGTTVDARNDLGVLVLMEISEWHQQISRYRHNATTYAIYAVGLVVLGVFSRIFGDGRMTLLIACTATGGLLSNMVLSHAASQSEKRLTKYRSELKKLWSASVEKRIAKISDI